MLSWYVLSGDNFQSDFTVSRFCGDRSLAFVITASGLQGRLSSVNITILNDVWSNFGPFRCTSTGNNIKIESLKIAKV